MKKDLVRVCRNWRIVATRYLYHRIYLHRIGHLCALAKVLEESASGHDGGADYSSCVHHVHMQFYVHPSWEAVYFKSFVSLLKLCTSARSLSWRITWDGAGVDPVLARCSTLNFTLLSQPSLRSTLSSLQKLTLALDKPTHQDTISNNDVKATLTFDNLEDMTCEATDPTLLEGLAFISQSFIMPKLQYLTFKVPLSFRDNITDDEVAFIFGMLESHGEKLSSLALDTRPITRHTTRISKGVGDILRYTPNLRVLRCSSITFHPIDTATITPTTYPKLQRLELLTSAECIPPISSRLGRRRGDLEQHLVTASSRIKFPSLQTIAIYDLGCPSVQIDNVIPRYRHDEAYPYFLAWSKRYRDLRTTLVGVNNEPIASR